MPANVRPVLHIRGLNYRAELWHDGSLVANSSELVGAFRHYMLPLQPPTSAGQSSVIALRVYRQHDRALPSNNNDTDLGISFVDWVPNPPDGNLGLFRNVSVYTANRAIVLHGAAANVTLLNVVPRGNTTADVSASAVVTIYNGETTAITNAELKVQFGTWGSASLFGVSMPAMAQTTVALPAAVLQQVPLWWPWRFGQQSMISMTLSLTLSEGEADAVVTKEVLTGLRQVTSSLDAHGSRLFKINGVEFAVFGGGYSPDLFLRRDGDWCAVEEKSNFIGVNHSCCCFKRY